MWKAACGCGGRDYWRHKQFLCFCQIQIQGLTPGELDLFLSLAAACRETNVLSSIPTSTIIHRFRLSTISA